MAWPMSLPRSLCATLVLLWARFNITALLFACRSVTYIKKRDFCHKTSPLYTQTTELMLYFPGSHGKDNINSHISRFNTSNPRQTCTKNTLCVRIRASKYHYCVCHSSIFRMLTRVGGEYVPFLPGLP